jgi:hypothetical protein
MLALRHIPFRPSTPVSSLWSDDDADSMASTSVTGAVPPLTRGNSVFSDSSAETDRASSIMGEGFLLDNEEGVLTVPDRYRQDADLLCPFQILDCEKVFTDIIPFKSHVFTHFRGHTLPTTASCFLCDKKFTQSGDDDDAWSWNQMLSHMAHEHYRRFGQQLATVRTDFALMRWMYSRRLINDHQFKRLQLVPIPIMLPGRNGEPGEVVNAPRVPMPPSAGLTVEMLAQLRLSVGARSESWTTNAGARAERRQRDATRHMVRSTTA